VIYRPRRRAPGLACLWAGGGGRVWTSRRWVMDRRSTRC